MSLSRIASEPVTQGPLLAHQDTVGHLWKQAPIPSIIDERVQLHDAVKELRNQPDQVGLLVRSQTGAYMPLYRVRAFVALAQPYVKDLYNHRPILDFVRQHHRFLPLIIPDDTTIPDAIESALSRDAEVRYDPILVCRAAQVPRMIDVRTLLEHQRKLLTHAFEEVDRQRREARLASLHDRLTGLPNRPHAMARLAQMGQAAAADNPAHYAVLFLDFDRFKLINDSLGHDAGDELLIQISHRMNAALLDFTGTDETDGRWLNARLGGDEFLVLLDQIESPDQAEEIAKSIVDCMRPTFKIRGYEVTSSPSIGIATSTSSDGTNPTNMLRDADAAMYRAKSLGRNRYVLFDQSMHDESMERLHLETQLRSALDRNQITPYYQPIVNCESGEIAGFEALARWSHPELGNVSPGRFIPIAEECGMIGPIGRFMLEQALAQLARWNKKARRKRPLYMSVNVSKRQLLQPDCVEHLKEVLETTGVDPSWVYLEVTESVVMDHADAAVAILNQIKTLGVKLSMDDFGTGLSSLTYLHKYPVDVLKIDQAFVKHLESKSIYTAVVQAIVTLAKNLNMAIVVEGIERIEQLVQIQALDCEYAQGYLFSKPVAANEASKLLAQDMRKKYKQSAA